MVPRGGNAAAGPDSAPRRVREPEVRAPDAAPTRSDATSAPRPRAPRAEPARDDGPPTGLTPRELATLYDAASADIAQLPKASQGDLLAQLAMLNIMRVLRASQPVRDDAAAQLWKLRQRVDERKAGR